MLNYKQELLKAGLQMLSSGLTVETWGNISLRDPESGLVYLTPSSMPYPDLVESDVVVSTLHGTIVEGTRKPTIEMEMHLEILRRRPDINVILHTHPIYSQVFALLEQPIPVVIDETAQVFGGEIPVAAYGLPGSAELRDNVADAIGPFGYACLMSHHGAVCVGATLGEAFKRCTVLEMTAQIYHMALQIGKPAPLAPHLVEAMLPDYMKNR